MRTRCWHGRLRLHSSVPPLVFVCGLLLFGSASQLFAETTGEDAIAGQTVLGINEPMYFVVGSDGDDTTARFQFSFNYRIFDEQGPVAGWLPWLDGMRFAYTQTSLWNLSEESAPFEDTSYRPSFFWQTEASDSRGRLTPRMVRFGYEHESNGRDEFASRSIDTMFVHATWREEVGERELLIVPKWVYYLNKDNNRDIRDYRGYGDLMFRVGRDDGWAASTKVRMGMEGYGSVQLDLSYPLRTPVFDRTGGYFYVQFFHGYGETLLGYDQKTDLAVRIGFSIIR